jgi:hypothetical protein
MYCGGLTILAILTVAHSYTTVCGIFQFGKEPHVTSLLLVMVATRRASLLCQIRRSSIPRDHNVRGILTPEAK